MARSKRKRCKVWLEVVPPKLPAHFTSRSQRVRCEGKIKPGTPFCKEHFETHKLIEVECTGEAHSNPFIDHCGVCMPHWGHYPIAVPKDSPGKPWEGSWE